MDFLGLIIPYITYISYIKSKINYFDKIICSHKKAKDAIFLKKFCKKKIYYFNNEKKLKKNLLKNYFFKKYNIPKNNKVICNISNINF